MGQAAGWPAARAAAEHGFPADAWVQAQGIGMGAELRDKLAKFEADFDDED